MSIGLNVEREAARQSLSSLMDGDLVDAAASGACAQWREDAAARQDWHAYHLIGDVLRSEELASEAGRDEVFLQRLRTRLAALPVPVAETPKRVEGLPSARVRSSWPWLAAAGVAGIAAVVGVVASLRDHSSLSAKASSALLAGDALPEVSVASGKLLRDAQLDRYLAAHRRASAGVSAVPGADVRNVNTIAIDDR